MKNRIFAFVGTTGVGKTYYSKYLVENHGLHYIPSVTTRPPREGNLDEYIHFTPAEYLQMIENDELLEYTIFNDHYYGKRKADVDSLLEKGHCVYTLTADRAVELKEKMPETVIVHLSLAEPIIENTVRRISERNLSEAELKSRINTIEGDLKDLAKLEKSGHIDHKIITLEGDKHATFGELDRLIAKYI